MVALKWLHRWLGLVFALPLCLVTLTGVLLLFKPTLEDWARPKAHAPRQGTLTLAAVVQIAQAHEPKGAIQFIRTPQDGAPWIVGVKAKQGQKRLEIAEDGHLLRIFAPWQTLTGWLYLLHTGFLAGMIGVYVVAIAGMALAVLAVLGLCLWWPSKRFIGLKKRIFLWDWHASVGVLTSLFLWVTGLTGSGLIFYDPLSHVLHRLVGQPIVSFEQQTPFDVQQFPFAEAEKKARGAMPSMRLTQVRFPKTEGAPIIFRFRGMNEWHPSGQNYVYFDGKGQMLDYRHGRDKPLVLQALDQLYPLHVAAGSNILKIAYAIFSVALLWLVISGFLLWRKKR